MLFKKYGIVIYIVSFFLAPILLIAVSASERSVTALGIACAIVGVTQGCFVADCLMEGRKAIIEHNEVDFIRKIIGK